MKIKLRSVLLLGMLLMGGTVAHAADSDLQPTRPHIVVGMIVDQMSWDYLYRYNDRYGDGGFRRLLKEGFNCQNARINYIPSVTAIGHSTVYTGSVPSIHGIAGNNFYVDGRYTYCTEDKTVQTVGAENGKSGQMSPRNMHVTTIADELKIATNFRSRVIGVALKDRGAILPAGHSADAAYWFDDKSGNFITSTYYMSDLPRWAKRFNDRRLAEKYLNGGWRTVHRQSSYQASIDDENPYEQPWGDIPATLPLATDKLLKREGLGVIRTTPMGNTLTIDMAMAAIEGERLGERKDSTDFIAVSLSSTDYVGHRYATFAVEMEDMYIRLDRDLSEFFTYLDKRYGKDGYLFFLTADHAVAHNTAFLADRKLPGRKWRTDIARQTADSVARAVLGTDEKVILDIMNYQVFLDEEKLQRLGADRSRLLSELANHLRKQDGVAYVVEADKAQQASIPEEIRYRIVNGYNHQRSGALFVVLHPGWLGGKGDKAAQGTSHAVWAPYDTHIPLIFMGHNVKPGFLYREVYMSDIAPTLAFMLKTQLPSGSVGQPIVELFE